MTSTKSRARFPRLSFTIICKPTALVAGPHELFGFFVPTSRQVSQLLQGGCHRHRRTSRAVNAGPDSRPGVAVQAKGQRRCCRASCSLGVVSPLCASFLWKEKGKKKGIDDEIGEEISFSLGLRGVALAVVVSQSSATAAECVRAGLNTDVHWSQRCSG